MQGHLELGRELAALRDEDVLILGSGNIVHNLRRMRAAGDAYDWAVEFDAYVRRAIETGYDDALVDYVLAGESAALSVPTTEHYLPLLYVVGARQAGEHPGFPVAGFDLGSLSMLSVAYGGQPIS
jgi:4,5-DOPA dioxygenase extradiol